MKQAWSDLKSFVTVSIVLTLIALIIIIAINQNWDMFQIVFTLFSSIASSVFTYYFTKKDISQNTENSSKSE